jgi:hypothetical protein
MARLASIAAILAVVVGCGAARDSGPGAHGTSVVVTRHSPSEVTTKVVGATPKQREILVDALSGIGETKLDVIEVTRAEKGWVDDPDAVGVGCSAGGEDLDMRSDWECWLATQALAVRSSELDLPVIAYVGGRGVGASSVGRVSPRKTQSTDTDAETKRIGQRRRRHERPEPRSSKSRSLSHSGLQSRLGFVSRTPRSSSISAYTGCSTI